MANCIVKLEGKYLVWSEISDAPITFGLTRDELVEWVRAREGSPGVRALPERLMRVDASGTSAIERLTPEDVMLVNRAGENEACISLDEIAERYVRSRRGGRA